MLFVGKMLGVPVVKVTIVKWRAILLVLVLLAFSLIASAVLLASQGKLTPYIGSLFAVSWLAYLFVQAAPLTNVLFRGEPYEVVADDSGLNVREFRSSRRVLWSSISTMEKSQMPKGNFLQETLTLRDASGTTQLQITRVRQESLELKEQYRQLEELIAERVGQKGVISSETFTTSPTKTTFLLVTQYKIIGLGSLLLWLPAAYFAWNAPPPNGGPAIGAGFLIFAALGVFLACADKRYEVDERGVRAIWFSKRDEVSWDDVRRMQLVRSPRVQRGQKQGVQTLLVFGHHNKVELAGPESWKEGGTLLQFLQSQAKRYNIEWLPDGIATTDAKKSGD